MVCIYCHSKTQVVNSRHLTRSNGTWRRRMCTNCSALFTTNEVAQYNMLWAIRDPLNGNLEPFERDRLFLTLYDSCKHRKSAVSDAAGLTDTVIDKLIKVVNGGPINKSDLKKYTYDVLKRFDKAAGVHYMAYNWPF